MIVETYSLPVKDRAEDNMGARRERSPITALVESPGADEIIRKATRLFAEHGYHGVSTRQLAAATGLNIATVHRHVGTKRELYRKVVERLYHEDRALVEAWSARLPAASVENADTARDVVQRLVDRVIERIAYEPLNTRLHMRRWFDPPDEISALESELYLKIYKPMLEFLERMRAAGVVSFEGDFRFFLRGVDWIVVGYFVAGPMSATQFRTDPLEPGNVAAFKQFLLTYVYRMLGIAPADACAELTPQKLNY